MSTRFGMWAASALPGLAALMGNYVERMCDSSEGLDAAVQLQAAAQRKRGVSNAGPSLEELLRMPPDAARRALRTSCQRPQNHQTSQASVPAPASDASNDSTGRGASSGGGADSSSAPGASIAADVDSHSESRPLVGHAWLWLLSHCLSLTSASDHRRECARTQLA